jgi:hypothetical protein
MCDVGGGASVGRIPGRIPGTRVSNLRLMNKSTVLGSQILICQCAVNSDGLRKASPILRGSACRMGGAKA